MNCVETNRLLNAYFDGELELQTALGIEAHLQECARCRTAAASLQSLQKAVSRSCEPAVAPAGLRSAVLAELSAAAARTPAPARGTWLAAVPGIAALLIAGWMLLTQPWNMQPSAVAANGMKVVYHIASGDHVDASLRTLKNHLDAAPGVQVVVVAHNSGIDFLLQGAKDSAGRPYVEILRDYRRRGVEFRVCTNTLTRQHIAANAVVPEAVLVPSGIAEIGRLQGREGYTYLRL